MKLSTKKVHWVYLGVLIALAALIVNPTDLLAQRAGAPKAKAKAHHKKEHHKKAHHKKATLNRGGAYRRPRNCSTF